MIEIVENFLDEYNLKNADKTFLVGFSGGCDSLCLLDILHELSKKYGFKLVALHLNHNWRGEESLQEEQNCRKFCEKSGIEFISETLDGNGQKSENLAREKRYQFFLKYAQKYPNSAIFTAHTQSDNAETIIYRIIKGTGINGLQGIVPARKLLETPLYRPLLSISRKQTEDYCSSKGLVPNNDSSNYDINYKRNYIRHKIIPLFDEINFNAEKSINSLAKLAISQTNIVNEYINKIMKEVYSEKKLLSEKFKNLSEDVQKRIIYDACLKYKLDYDYKKITNILDFIKSNYNSKSGSRYSLTNDLWLFVNSKNICVITKTNGEKIKDEIDISSEGEWIFTQGKAFSLQKYTGGEKIEFPGENASFAYVNLEDIGLGSGLNLTIRTRRDGDFITPFGMSGSMKLKKYLNSKGISRHEKDELILLCKGSEVFWVAGVGLSNKLKVVNKPTHVIKLLDR